MSSMKPCSAAQKRSTSPDASASSVSSSISRSALVRPRNETDDVDCSSQSRKRRPNRDEDTDPPRIERQHATREGYNQNSCPPPSPGLPAIPEARDVAQGVEPCVDTKASSIDEMMPRRCISERSAKALATEGSERCCVCLDASTRLPHCLAHSHTRHGPCAPAFSS